MENLPTYLEGYQQGKNLQDYLSWIRLGHWEQNLLNYFEGNLQVDLAGNLKD